MENSNPKISVITPTIRPEGIKVLQQCLEAQTFKDFEWLVEVGFPGKSDLNAALNRMIRRAKGELLVFYQDNIIVSAISLDLFWQLHKQHPAFYTAPLGDWRNNAKGTRREFTDWEIDWGSCPREAMEKIGGFDETLDEYWGFDNVNAGLRATMAGYEIWVADIPGERIDHAEAPMKKNRNPEYHNYRLDQIRQGTRVNFL